MLFEDLELRAAFIWSIFYNSVITVDPVSSGQHKINIQQHNSNSRHKFMLFYAFKMAMAIAFLRGNSKS